MVLCRVYLLIIFAFIRSLAAFEVFTFLLKTNQDAWQAMDWSIYITQLDVTYNELMEFPLTLMGVLAPHFCTHANPDTHFPINTRVNFRRMCIQSHS